MSLRVINGASTEAYRATQYFVRRATPPSLYYKLRTFCRQYPSLFLPFSSWRWRRWRRKYVPENTHYEPAAPFPLSKNTEIVIEGFPRTANTFAHIAFKLAQDEYINIGHHTHAAAQVIAAVRRRVPTIVLIRDPEEAIISYIVGEFDPKITMRQVLQDYIAFYKPILPHRNEFVLAPFRKVVTSYGEIIGKVNNKYGTCFNEFKHTEKNIKQCFDLIDQGFEKSFGSIKENVISRPSDSRHIDRNLLEKEFRSDKLSRLRDEAYNLYNTLMQSIN
ncbi:hypothetical protein [Lyngbya confervoides]|uniref:Sulfotransferase domain-containing protein n=1 Tax=Lyngbya confervoides BDU141951 TaxID=1574623 RepID=A0ABD4T7Y8_9CYAN|nr:hypothetical protein [Lyngbya confervoides]MCM1984894.1 hypothetical protein [Lyngbya confervoides BDU141951]